MFARNTCCAGEVLNNKKSAITDKTGTCQATLNIQHRTTTAHYHCHHQTAAQLAVVVEKAETELSEKSRAVEHRLHCQRTTTSQLPISEPTVCPCAATLPFINHTSNSCKLAKSPRPTTLAVTPCRREVSGGPGDHVTSLVDPHFSFCLPTSNGADQHACNFSSSLSTGSTTGSAFWRSPMGFDSEYSGAAVGYNFRHDSDTVTSSSAASLMRESGDGLVTAWDSTENLIQQAKLEECRRRADRELIRRRLADVDDCDARATNDDALVSCVSGSSRGRLVDSRNLQICFMNEVASDYEDEDQCGDNAADGQKVAVDNSKFSATAVHVPCVAAVSDSGHNSVSSDILASEQTISPPTPTVKQNGAAVRVQSRSEVCGIATSAAAAAAAGVTFSEYQRHLQVTVRSSLAEAQLSIGGREIRTISNCSGQHAVTAQVIQLAFRKIGVALCAARGRASRHVLSNLNISQLQVIVNELHAKIEQMNEQLVVSLMSRDEAFMEQDSRLVHIEDLTTYYAQKHAQ